MDIIAYCFFDKFFGDAEAVGQFPEFGTALGDGFIQVVYRDQVEDGPFVGAVFMALSGIG